MQSLLQVQMEGFQICLHIIKEKFPQGNFYIQSKFFKQMYEICFVVIYAVLSPNRFCHNICAFVWRKNEPKSAFVEKK